MLGAERPPSFGGRETGALASAGRTGRRIAHGRADRRSTAGPCGGAPARGPRRPRRVAAAARASDAKYTRGVLGVSGRRAELSGRGHRVHPAAVNAGAGMVHFLGLPRRAPWCSPAAPRSCAPTTSRGTCTCRRRSRAPAWWGQRPRRPVSRPSIEPRSRPSGRRGTQRRRPLGRGRPADRAGVATPHAGELSPDLRVAARLRAVRVGGRAHGHRGPTLCAGQEAARLTGATVPAQGRRHGDRLTGGSRDPQESSGACASAWAGPARGSRPPGPGHASRESWAPCSPRGRAPRCPGSWARGRAGTAGRRAAALERLHALASRAHGDGPVPRPCSPMCAR
ncbi:hypothetical protein QJS66_20645 [Kocuria rhizophila]|nr:hypothetical protein QJS66_20645 [Kocuria rhizophila]